MFNQLILVGKIRKLPIIEEMKSDNEIIVEVKRNYKNVDGVYEKDCFRCYLWIAISKKISLCCKEGDLVVVKGRLVDDESKCRIVAEQVVLLNRELEKKVKLC